MHGHKGTCWLSDPPTRDTERNRGGRGISLCLVSVNQHVGGDKLRRLKRLTSLNNISVSPVRKKNAHSQYMLIL